MTVSQDFRHVGGMNQSVDILVKYLIYQSIKPPPTCGTAVDQVSPYSSKGGGLSVMIEPNPNSLAVASR